MAIVPTSQGASLETRPSAFVPQNVQFDPNAFGAGVGQATQGLGRTMGAVSAEGAQIATNMAIENDQLAHKVADTDAEKRATDIGYSSLPGGPEGNKGYYSLKGQDAVTYRPAYQKAMDDVQQQISESLKDSPRAQNWFNQTSTQRAGAAYRASGAYAMNQGIDAANNASGARLSAFKDSLTIKYNDPEALANFEKVTRGEVADTGRRMGWGPDQIAEETTKALSGGYRDAILARVTSGDIAGAGAMFHNLAPGMDAGTRVGLAQHLQPLLTGADADARVKAKMGTAGGGASSDIYSALKAQEGPGVSDKGANEGLMPATFKQYARAGESFDNSADRAVVNRRVIDDLSQKANGDPERIAVGYFSGPGNMSAPGSALPYINDTNDGHKSVSSYVADINHRLGRTPGPPAGNASDANPAVAPNWARMQQELIDETAGNDMLQRATLSRFHTAHSQWELSTQGDRDTIEKNWNDTVAAATAGNDTASIDEAKMRHVFAPGKADYMIGQFHEAVIAGQVTGAIKMATPGQTNLILSTLAADVKDEDPAHFVQRNKLLAAATSAVAQKQKALDTDPATYAMQNPSVAAAYQAVDQNKPETLQAAVDASFSTQRTLGVASPSVLGTADAAKKVKEIETPNQADMGQALNKLQNDYGPHYSDVVADLTRAGLSPRYQVLAAANHPGQETVKADAQAAFQMFDGMKDKSEWSKGVPGDQEKLVKPAVDGAVAAYRQTLQGSSDPRNIIATTIIPAITQTAQYYMTRGMPAQAAVEKAADLINKSYSFDDELRVPTGPGMPTVSQVRGSMDTLAAGLTDADLKGTSAAEARYYGTWFTDGDDKGATLFKGTSQGGYMPVRRADGSYMSVDFRKLPTATTGAAAAVAQAPPQATQALGAVN